jgi:hypothetical protein
VQSRYKDTIYFSIEINGFHQILDSSRIPPGFLQTPPDSQYCIILYSKTTREVKNLCKAPIKPMKSGKANGKPSETPDFRKCQYKERLKY